MDEMMSEVFEALLEAGATEAKAKEAARAVTRHGQDLLQDINQRLFGIEQPLVGLKDNIDAIETLNQASGGLRSGIPRFKLEAA